MNSRASRTKPAARSLLLRCARQEAHVGSASGASRIATAVLCTSAVLPVWAGKPAEPTLAVYCAGVEEHGFLRPDVADSVRDLREALAGKKRTLHLVDDAAAAHVIVIVEGRARGPRP